MRTLVSIMSLLFILAGKTSYAGVTSSFERTLSTVTVEKEQGPAWHVAIEHPVGFDDADVDNGEETAFDSDYDGPDASFAAFFHLRDDWLHHYVAPSSVLFVPSLVSEHPPLANSLPIYLQNRVIRI